jgi:hypothetical protein
MKNNIKMDLKETNFESVASFSWRQGSVARSYECSAGTFMFHKRRRISRLGERLLASPELWDKFITTAATTTTTSTVNYAYSVVHPRQVSDSGLGYYQQQNPFSSFRFTQWVIDS